MSKTKIPSGLAVAAALGLGYALWKRFRRPSASLTPAPASRVQVLLARAAPLLRLPASPDRRPEVLPDGAGLRCPVSGDVFPYRDGVLDLLAAEQDSTFTQDFLDTPLTAWAYDRSRGMLTRALNSPDFAEEVVRIQRTLEAGPGDIILDLACGHGNFTIEWAKRVGPEGLVIGLDNVLLVRGDAHHLPMGDGVLSKVNCSGGFHQFPHLPQALREIGRVSAGDAVLTASTFARQPGDPNASLKRWLGQRFDLYFVPLVRLGEQLAAVGYADYEWSLPGGWFGYTSARKTGDLIGGH